MRGRLALAAALLAGCVSARSALPPVECGRFVEADRVVRAAEPIRRCYIHAYDPATWGHMSTASWILSRSITVSYPGTFAALPIVNGFVSSLSDAEAEVMASIKGVTVYECGRAGSVSDLDVIAFIGREAERSKRKVPRPEALKIPMHAEGAVAVAACRALEQIRVANVTHGGVRR